jgi:hypothetical protein
MPYPRCIAIECAALKGSGVSGQTYCSTLPQNGDIGVTNDWLEIDCCYKQVQERQYHTYISTNCITILKRDA